MAITFKDRHIGPRDKDIKEMLGILGLGSLDELAQKTVPQNVLLKEDIKLSAPMSENAYLAHLKEMVSKNKNFRSLIGMGFYGTGTLPVIVRNIFENPVCCLLYTSPSPRD